MKFLLLTMLCALIVEVNAQNVGIGTTNPQHPLDVNGDINLSGVLRIGGTDPGSNKILSTNNTGVMQWANIHQYENHETFTTFTPGIWTVPAAVTKIMVEAWGGGGGGSCVGGGGGGGYVSGYFTVTPGSSVSYDVGIGGTGVNCETTTSNNGEITTVSVGSVTLTANYGKGSYRYSSTSYWIGRGGGYNVSLSTFRNFFGAAGEDGTPNDVEFKTLASGVSRTVTRGGKGGNAANTEYTGSLGGYVENSGTIVLRYITGGESKSPGGGGNGNTDVSFSYYGSAGSPGMIIIHY